LTVSGYKTGLYISPHLHTLRERIRVDGNLISQAEFASLVAEVKPYFEAMNHDPLYRQLTFFEVLTVLAFAYFKQKQADFQVLEVGLGGRLDATNVAEPEVCVITPISLEHTQVLGDSLEKIAHEKAGIVKLGSFVVSSPQLREVSQVISDVCRQRGANLVQVGEDVTWRRIAGDFQQQAFVIQGKMGMHHLSIPLLGDYQVENAATAVATLEVLASLGFAIAAADIARGLAQVEWPGRFQILSHGPVVLVDGAHNVAAMQRLVGNIKAYFSYDRLFLIIGISCDKDIPGIVKELIPLSPRVTVTRSSHSRAASPSVIAAEFTKWGITSKASDAVSQALFQTLSTASNKDLVCITGSLFVVAEALDYAASHSNF
jgi:dihydrofolate synthase/folylpolyglutamate synthase